MIVIPMAGLSKRFADAGYAVPKFMLRLNGQSVFSRAVSSFKRYFLTLPFLFIARGGAATEAFIRGECAALGVADVTVVLLDAPTAGQAETVELGLAGTAIPEIVSADHFQHRYLPPGVRDARFRTMGKLGRLS